MTESTNCAGSYCHSKHNCKRYTEQSKDAINAALWARRLPGDSACDCYLPIVINSTFNAKQEEY